MTDDITIKTDTPNEPGEVRGIFLLPMTHGFARGLVAELEKVALQLGPMGRDFYEGLSEGLRRAEAGEQGLLYDSAEPTPSVS